MVVELEKIEPIIHDFVNTAAEEYQVKQAMLFGSYAQGTYREWSDVDIALFIEEDNEIELNNISVKLRGSAVKMIPENWDTYIEPHVFSADLLATNEPFIQKILATGRPIEPANGQAEASSTTMHVTVPEFSVDRQIIQYVLDDMRAVLGRKSFVQLHGSAALALSETGPEVISSMTGVPMEDILKGVTAISAIRQLQTKR